MNAGEASIGRRERNKREKRERILDAARDLFAEFGVGAVTTQQVADRADVAVGTLFRYASTKAELLIMVQNEKFAEAIDEGLATAQHAPGALSAILVLIRPVIGCIRGQLENGQAYLRELMFGDPGEPYRREGLALSAHLEAAVSEILIRETGTQEADAARLARVVTAVIHMSTTAAVYQDRPNAEVLADIHEQVAAILGPREHATASANGDPMSQHFEAGRRRPPPA
jgi:AcrR family transcriptional regulator